MEGGAAANEPREMSFAAPGTASPLNDGLPNRADAHRATDCAPKLVSAIFIKIIECPGLAIVSGLAVLRTGWPSRIDRTWISIFFLDEV
jgi:hypothetical protein